MKIVAAGVSGFLGTRLTAALTDAGHQVTRLVRSDPKGPSESLWNPHSGDLDTSVFDGADAVINLCGTGVGRSPLDQRLQVPADQFAGEPHQAARRGMCAAGYSGTDQRVRGRLLRGARHGDRHRGGPRGRHASSAQLCVQWEAATAAARDADVRVVNLRTGLVLGKDGGSAAQG